jgi:hypothetical protein
LWRPGIGVTGSDWLWVAVAVLLDIAHWGASAGSRGRAGRATVA